jgi:hypothetical protein
MKHTPGPWHVTKCNCASGRCQSLQVLTVLPAEAHLSRADAYLISAAPDMLEALEMILSANEAIADATRQSELERARCNYYKARDRAKAAVLKAKGAEQ